MYNINKDSEGFYYDAVGYCIPTIYRACKNIYITRIKSILCTKACIFPMCKASYVNSIRIIYIQSIEYVKVWKIGNPKVLYIRARIL